MCIGKTEFIFGKQKYRLGKCNDPGTKLSPAAKCRCEWPVYPAVLSGHPELLAKAETEIRQLLTLPYFARPLGISGLAFDGTQTADGNAP